MVRPLLALLAALLLLSACGYVGDPLPPALNIPVTITDLRAAEIGPNIVVEFTIPDQTTEGLALKEVRAVEISVTPEGGAAQMVPVNTSAPGPVSKDIPVESWVGKTIVITARSTGPKGKASAWSNPARLSVIAPVPAPSGLRAQNDPRGVALSWQGSGAKYRVFRATGDSKPASLADTDQPNYLDDSTEYGTEYRYLVQALESESQQSNPVGPVSITPADTFAPAVPAGVNGVAGVRTIELAWERNTEPDFAAYNLYRSVENGPFERIAAGITAPTYSDTQVESGKRYRYRVSAIDTTGNESEQSPAIEVVAQ